MNDLNPKCAKCIYLTADYSTRFETWTTPFCGAKECMYITTKEATEAVAEREARRYDNGL